MILNDVEVIYSIVQLRMIIDSVKKKNGADVNDCSLAFVICDSK